MIAFWADIEIASCAELLGIFNGNGASERALKQPKGEFIVAVTDIVTVSPSFITNTTVGPSAH